MLVPLPHRVFEALQVLKCLRSGFNYKGVFRLELFKTLAVPFTPTEARNEIPNKSSDRPISVFYYANRWLMLNKKNIQSSPLV